MTKARRRRSSGDSLSEDGSEDDEDFDLEDEDLILNSMDDMMSSVRDGISQRNQSYHSICPLGWVHMDEKTCGSSAP